MLFYIDRCAGHPSTFSDFSSFSSIRFQVNPNHVLVYFSVKLKLIFEFCCRWSFYLGGCVRCADQRRHRSDSLHLHNAEIPASTRPVVCGHGSWERQQQPPFQFDVHQVKGRSELLAADAVASSPTDELGSTPPSHPPNFQGHRSRPHCRRCRSSGPDGRHSRSVGFNWNGQPPVAHGRPEKFLVTINSTTALVYN